MQNGKPDAFEILVGEWIGSVGMLHQDIKKLPVALQSALSQTVDSLESAQSDLLIQLKQLPGAADRAMKRAGEEELRVLSSRVADIAQKVAADAAAEKKARAFTQAVVAAVIGALVIGGVGYAAGWGAAALSTRVTKIDAQAAVEAAEMRAEDAEQKARDDVDAVRKASGWAGTAEGLLARRFFASGAGQIAATCAAEKWDIKEGKDGKYPHLR